MSTMNSTLQNLTVNSDKIFDRFQFVTEIPGLAIPCLIMLCISSVSGTFGNILTLIAVCTVKKLHRMECIFIVNLACSDLYVTTIAIPFSVVAKIEGEQFFNKRPGYCRTIGSICSISCVVSLGTIALLSFNRYIFICRNNYYYKIFNKSTCIGMCVGLYACGLLIVLLNLVGIGDHSFDRKSLDCLWDRMATYSYTVIVSTAFVWVPLLIVGFSYLRIYLEVRKSQKAVRSTINNSPSYSTSLARSFFLIYTVFAVCWAPYALLAALDKDDKYSLEVYLYITTWAHMHPSLNWIIYYFTNTKFKAAFNHLVHLDTCFGICNCKKKNKDQSSVVDEVITSETLLRSKTSGDVMRYNFACD